MNWVERIVRDAGLGLERGGEEAGVAGPVARRVRTRRQLLFGGALGSSLLAGRARGGTGTGGFSPERWLVQRITFGLDPEQLALAESLGYEGYLEHHLNPAAIDDTAMDERLANYTTLTMQPYELIPLPNLQAQAELIEATILRAVFSKRQLLERMVEFWTDHFNIDINNGIDNKLKTIDDREVIRANALGTFPALLSASAHSPAMLYYLDNAVSVVGNPNENYARELMELHTLGVDGGYTQTDVVEVARCLTGWTLYPANFPTQSLRWTFQFAAGNHDNGEKVVLGVTIPPGGGINDGLTVLNLLTNHPSTATFLATKLCRRFWSEDPPAALIDAVADAYTSSGGDIKEMLRALFLTLDPATAAPKYKRPFHQFAAALRGTAATVLTTSGIRTMLTSAGQVPFNWSPPDGYPDALDHWVGLILPRWNFGASLMAGQIAGASVDPNLFFAGVPNDADALADHIDVRLFDGAMPAADRDRIRDYLLPNPPTSLKRREAIGLAIGSPAFQWI